LLPATNKISSNNPASKLTPYVDKIIDDHQCGLRHNRSTTDLIICVHQILENKCEYNGTVSQLFTDSEKAYDSVRREYCTILSLKLE
jgi:hypothetical protein